MSNDSVNMNILGLACVLAFVLGVSFFVYGVVQTGGALAMGTGLERGTFGIVSALIGIYFMLIGFTIIDDQTKKERTAKKP